MMGKGQVVEVVPARGGRHTHTRAGGGLRHEGRRVIGVVQVAEDVVVHYAVALLLVGVAGTVLFRSGTDFFDASAHAFPERVTAVINSVLFVIIVMEILRTVVARFDDAGLQLKPFLIIGFISAVRHQMTVRRSGRIAVESPETDPTEGLTR